MCVNNISDEFVKVKMKQKASQIVKTYEITLYHIPEDQEKSSQHVSVASHS
jgi:hypothetical protein